MIPKEPDASKLSVPKFPNQDHDDASELSDGLAVTREQVSDVYMAGTSDGILFAEGGVPRKAAGGREAVPGESEA
ncbi:hypothetical protein GCM10025857_22000 [Alicyclobacillus contaminans]|uniref:YozQ family protein n=1 Tax=Alicyclobacillus contaminans TaxID=392016 RepID=UPI000406E461|nr:YozQ family protein [Alicyclobacillus contaminans]GMA50843.1 hypothetical protein GCM10025857_22000 [Alicyclobacillus contaminans]